MAKRMLVIGSLLVLLVLLLASGSVPVRALSFPQFGDSIHDYGVDLDSDGDFDELQIDFTVRIMENATYGFEAILGNENFPYLLRDSFEKTLVIGEHTLTVKFLGPYIRKAEAHGPYVVRFEGSVFVGSVRWSGSSRSYATSDYDPAWFDPPGAVLANPVSDEGRDTNGDGLFDEIVVRLSIETVKDVVVMAQASMSANGLDGWASVETPFGDFRRFSKGIWPMEFALDALPLYAVRATGPYRVDLRLVIEGLGPIDFRSHTTAAYPYTAFRRPSADFRAPGPSIGLLDPDGNGLVDLFVVRVPLTVTEAGDFLFQSNLWVSGYPGGLFQSARATHLDRGDQVAEIPFSGIELSRAGTASDNWTLEVRVNRVDSSEYDRNRTAWFTQGIDPARFESRPLAYFSGRILPLADPQHPECRIVSLLDPATKFAAEQVTYGTFSIPAYPGNFTVLVRGCSPPTKSSTSYVNVVADAPVNLSLGTASTDALQADLNLTTWETARRTLRTHLFDRAPRDRFVADQFGNRDGVADAAELRIIRTMESRYLSHPFAPSDLLIDGRPIPYRSIVTFEVEGAGPVVSTAELTETLVADSWLLVEPLGILHNVTLWLTYDSPIQTSRLTIRLPPGSTGTATSHGNVTVVPIGPSAWAIDPGMSPDTGSGPPPSRLNPAYVTIDAVAPGGALGAALSVPFEWVLLSGVVVAAASIGIAAWWVHRRGRRPPNRDPEVKGPS